MAVNQLFAQQGVPAIVNYPPSAYASPDYPSSIQNWGMAQDASGLLYVANTSAVLTFNGQQWQAVANTFNKQFLKLAANAEGLVFTGGIEDLGYIAPDSAGALAFVSLKQYLPDPAQDFQRIVSVATYGTKAYFHSRSYLFEWNGSTITAYKPGKGFYKVFANDAGVFADESPNGLSQLVEAKFVLVSTDEWLKNRTIRGVWPLDDAGECLFVATKRQGLCRVCNGQVTQLNPELDSLVIYNTTRLADGTFALGTDGHGIYVVTAEGQVVTVIDESDGLQQTQVPYPFVDRHGGLWAATYSGVSRIEYPTPLTYISKPQGLDGAGVTAARFNNRLYFGTFSGLFRLHDAQAGANLSLLRPTQIEEYTTSLLVANNELLIGTQAGVYSMDSTGKIVQLTEHLDAILFQEPGNANRVFIGTRQAIGIMEYRNGSWDKTELQVEVPHYIRFLATDKDGNLWASHERISRIQFSEDFETAEVVTLDSTQQFVPEMGVCQVVNLDGDLCVATEIGLFQINNQSNALEPDDRLQIEPHGKPKGWVANLSLAPDGSLWGTTEAGSGLLLNADGSVAANFDAFARVGKSDINAIFHDENEAVWLLGSDRLARLDLQFPKRDRPGFQTLIQQVTARNDSNLFSGSFAGPKGQLAIQQPAAQIPVLQYGANHLQFRYAANDYEAIDQLEFSHRLVGLEDNWTAWSSATSNEYTNLLEGDYTFEVRSRNIFGQEGAIAAYSFSILPPWYRTFWAYVAYAVVLLLAMLALVRANTYRLIRAKRRLEATVEERTAEVVQQKEEIEQLLEQKQEALLRAEASEKAKELFLANMSHEIRTPLNAVIGFTEILRREEHTERQEEFLETIQTSGENLLVIINDILDFSKIEAGKLEIESIPFSLKKTLQACDAMLRPKAEAKLLGFNIHLDTQIPPVLVGDPVRMSQILINLVNNAIKFTESGRVDVEVRLQNQSESTANIQIDVGDTGIGIPADKLDSIFESFSQAGADTTRKYGGTGLGTTIVKRLVELQGGSITATSAEGEGSTFSISLPLKISEIAPAELETTAGGLEAFKPKTLVGKVLVADDNIINQRLAHEVLSGFGLAPDYADNGRIAVEMLEQTEYDLILMDLQMPEMDGIAATQHIRQHLPAPKRSTPIVAMTAHSLVSHVERCKAAGMQDHVSKPFKQAELYRVLQQYLLEQDGAPEPKTEQAAPKQLESNSGALLDLSYLNAMSAGNNAFTIEMLEMVRDNTTADLERVSNLLQQNDLNGVRAAVHKSASSLLMLGNVTLQELFKTVERNIEENQEIESVPQLVEQMNALWKDVVPEINSTIETLR